MPYDSAPPSLRYRNSGRTLGSKVPTPAEIKRLATISVNAAMSEIMSAYPSVFPMEAAEALMRETAFNLSTWKGANPTAEKLYALGNEVQGIG